MLNLNQHRNSKIQGNVGVGIAIAWFMSAGYDVSIPVTDSQDYDLVIGVDNDLSTVQVKTSYCLNSSGNYQVNLRVLGGNRSGTGKVKLFDSQAVDYVFIVTDSNEKYFIPSADIDNKTSVTLSSKYDKYLVT
jgi:hypothetical protein